jgi:hypothetical protein
MVLLIDEHYLLSGECRLDAVGQNSVDLLLTLIIVPPDTVSRQPARHRVTAERQRNQRSNQLHVHNVHALLRRDVHGDRAMELSGSSARGPRTRAEKCRHVDFILLGNDPIGTDAGSS